MEVTPFQLTDGNLRPRPLRLSNVSAEELSHTYGMQMRGENLQVVEIRPLSGLGTDVEHPPTLSYLTASAFASQLDGVHGAVVITTDTLASFVPNRNTTLVTEGNPKEVFYRILSDAVLHRTFEQLQSHISPSATISPAANVSENVYVDDDAYIAPGAVIYPNTYIGRGAVVKANAVVGGDGFETARSGERKKIVPHAGGVWLADGVQVGSCTCIDKGLFGDFTYVGEDTKIDNLVHFAHSARTGKECSLIACSEISGSVVLGDGVWVGPNVTVNQLLTLGSHCFIGSGSVVTKSLQPFALAFGSPAQQKAWVCECRTKLDFVDNVATCSVCGTGYTLDPAKGVNKR